jgi:hypothetical protein
MGNVSGNDELSAKITGEELMTGFLQGKYDHLKIIMSKNTDCRLGQLYLMVTEDAFGVVKLCDISFNENNIDMVLQDEKSGIVKHVFLDINDNSFKFLLISWDDIIRMIPAFSNTYLPYTDLLEFDY